MLATVLIVFREVIEAGLIVGIVLAATHGIPRRGLWVGYGVAGGAAGACLVAAFAGQLSSLFQGTGQELFNAGVLLVAVAMLTWHNVWMASHGRALAEGARQLGQAVVTGRKPLLAVSVVCGVAVLREGAEIVLFLSAIAFSGGASPVSMAAGGAIGVLGGVALSTVVYLGLVTIPIRRLFAVTSVLVALLAAGLAAQAVAFLQQAGQAELLTSTVWDTSWLVPEDGLPGRLLRTLVGYTDRPTGAQLGAYVLCIAVTVGLVRVVRPRARSVRPRPVLDARPPAQESRAHP